MPSATEPPATLEPSTEAAVATNSGTIDLLRNRVSVRSFLDRPLDDSLLETILSAAFRAPTSSNIQSYSVIVVRDGETKSKLSAVTGNQKHVRDAPVFLAFCADLTRIDRALAANGHDLEDNNLEIGLVSSIDAALVGMSASLAAESLGVKGVMIGAVRNDAAATAKILGLPRHVYCVFGMCLGFARDVPPQKPRMDYNAMTHYERYDNHGGVKSSQKMLQEYDARLASHYQSVGKPTDEKSWSHDMDKKFNPQLRDQLRPQLQQLGFDFR